MPGVMLNIGNIRGGGPATNVVPDFAEAQLDLRVTRMADRDPFLARLHALAAPINAREGFRLELTGAFNRPPKESGPVEAAALDAYRDADLFVLPTLNENFAMTVAASGHWPMASAPVTATDIKALMLSLSWKSALTPFL